MTHTWPRRALGVTVLVALAGLGLVVTNEVGGVLSHPVAAVSGVADHSPSISLPESRPPFGFVEPLALFGLALALVAGRLDLRLAPASLVPSDRAIRQRRWRARLEGAPPPGS
jgi:hypothetical protein